MKKTVIFFLLAFYGSFVSSQCPIIPTPQEYSHIDLKIPLGNELRLDSTSIDRASWNYLKLHLKLQTGIDLVHDRENPFITVKFMYEAESLTHDRPIALSTEYAISFTAEKRIIQYTTEESQFYAMNSLLQLIRQDGMNFYLQGCQLSDAPAFEWRGLHLDVSRHFYTVDEVKRFIDLMALYKFNTFHWHLTDDQGWRIEIKQYPKLTEIGGFRDSTLVGHYSDQPRVFEKETYGGFYTQDEIREVIQYAQDRFITVVPEIELPGHSRAALAAYPELSCTGEQMGVVGTWGVFDDIFCSKPETIQFLKNVLDEVIALFPSEYIHIGGDEAPKTRWKQCAKCQGIMKQNGLHDEHELQSYFIRQMDAHLTAKGKKIIGWDEILEGGLSPNAAVMSWRGMKGGIDAADQKHDVVMSPTTYCYFDYYQSGHPSEPLAIGGFLPLEKVYQFNPIPDGISEESALYILGGQANLWTEYVATMDHVEYMVYPRALAIAQAVWCTEKPSYAVFLDDYLRYQEEYLDRYSVNYSRSIHQPELQISRKKNGMNVHFKGVEPDYHFSVSMNEMGGSSMNGGKVMGKSDTLFMERITWGTDPKLIRTAVQDESGKPPVNNDFLLHSTLGAPIEMVIQPNPKYNNNGSLNLVDGITGSLPWKGSQWLGFDTTYIEFIVDLEAVRSIREVKLGFLDQNGSWIYLPETVEIQIAKASKWKGVKVFQKRVDSSDFRIPVKKKGRYVRVIVRAMQTIPEGQEGGGFAPWTFIDEIQLK